MEEEGIRIRFSAISVMYTYVLQCGWVPCRNSCSTMWNTNVELSRRLLPEKNNIPAGDPQTNDEVQNETDTAQNEPQTAVSSPV